jgi:hypothetical protein
VRARVSGTALFVLTTLLSALAAGHSQVPASAPPGLAPPQAGFVPPYEITRTVRSAGFDPVAPPLREGTTYVLRATDFRGILMRVVVDADTGRIRAVNRIVPGPGNYGQIGMASPPYGPADDMLPSYGTPPQFGGPPPPNGRPALPPPPVAPRPPDARTAAHPIVTVMPPLPRPRPAGLATRKPADDAKENMLDSKPDPKIETKPDVRSDVTTAVPAPAPTTAPAKPNKPSPGPPIND